MQIRGRAANGSVAHGSMGQMGHVLGMGQWVMGHMPWVMTHQYFDSLII